MKSTVMNLVRAAGAAVALAVVMPASAVQFSFSCITNNSGFCSSVAPQMSVNVVDVGGTQASFTFTNIGTTSSFIGQIYFDTAGVFSGFNTLTNTSGEAGESTGVNFRTGSGNLPSGNTANPAFTADYAFDAVPPPAQNGINNGTTTVFESLTVFGAYASGQGFSSLLSSFNSGATRIGIHVQGIGQFSESMITVVPVPAALPLMLSGLVGLGFLARRRTRS